MMFVQNLILVPPTIIISILSAIVAIQLMLEGTRREIFLPSIAVGILLLVIAITFMIASVITTYHIFL